jgi:DNA replication and repair protein RecF
VRISHLSLTNFRSYPSLDLEFAPGNSIFIGENGEGKTNIVESIIYLSLLESHRVSSDQPLITLGAERSYIRARTESDDARELLVELEINPERANRAQINKQPTRSQREILGLVSTTHFSPEDLDLVRGDPSERRKFLDHLLIQQNPRYAGIITDYERSLRQRNSLLKARAPRQSLEPWDRHIIEFGSQVIEGRLSLLEKLNPHLSSAYNSISTKKEFTTRYKSSTSDLSTNRDENKKILQERLEEVHNQERERGVTLIGPHRDDLELKLDANLVKGFASHGESWSVALSLKISSYLLLREEGKRPILILDDVFSELDLSRREHLTNLTESADQTLITVAVADDLPKNLNGERFFVKEGHVKKVSL